LNGQTLLTTTHSTEVVNALTDRLAHPNPKHVQLQQTIVESFAALQIHEQMIDETPAPWRNGTEEMTPGEEPKAALPQQIWWYIDKDVDDGNT